jgi:hypothetical protein
VQAKSLPILSPQVRFTRLWSTKPLTHALFFFLSDATLRLDATSKLEALARDDLVRFSTLVKRQLTRYP